MTAIADVSPAAAIFAHDPTNPHVLVVDGYGLEISVSRGHLIIHDGLGRYRRERRLPRAQRTVQRLLILGHTGHITLEAIRWCHDTGIAIIGLNSNGTLMLTAGKTGVNDARLRRAQAAAATSHVGLNIAKGLLGAKIDGQAAVTDTLLNAQSVADLITETGERLSLSSDLVEIRGLEAPASNSYFGAWARAVGCRFAASVCLSPKLARKTEQGHRRLESLFLANSQARDAHDRQIE